MSANKPIQMPMGGDRLVDRYTVVERVSLGGFGAVYKAVQDTLGREVAIKILLPEIFANRDYVEQFRQEALLTSQLRHPNTITVFDYGQTSEGLLFLVMEWLDGKTLSQLLREGVLSYERCHNIAHQILKSLSEAHDRGMVHRDLKPSNLFLSEQYGETDFVKVLDFGLVKNLSSKPLIPAGEAPIDAPKFTEKRRAPGTPHYMAPEQATGKGTTTASDIYSFGLILYEMMTGQRAFDGTDKMQVLLKQAREQCPPLPEAMQSTFLGRIVAKCVQKNPKKRPQKAGVLAREFQGVENSGGVEVHTAEIRTTDSWRAMAEPKSMSDELASGPAEEFVGRDSELQEFGELLNVSFTQPAVVSVMVSGEAGIGKTTLLQRFVEKLTERAPNAHVLRGGFLPQHPDLLSGVRTAIKGLLNLRVHDASDIRHQIRQGLDTLGVQDFYLLNFLSNFLFNSFGSRGDQLDECNLRLESLLRGLAEKRPVLFLLENLHWADEGSLGLIWRLASAVAETPLAHPIFIISTFRTEERHENRELSLQIERLNRLDHQRYREMRLGALGPRDCRRLIQRGIDMQREMVRRCLTLSRGNPQWLTLVVRYLVDEAEHIGRQASDDGALGESKLYLPSSLDKIALRRIDQVVRKYGQETFREVLRRAALVGENFMPALLERVLRRERQYELLDRMTWSLELWRREGLLRRVWDSNDHLEFIHPHLIEYFEGESEPKLHLIVAQSKEGAAKDLEDFSVDAAELARHFRAGEEPALAVRYLLDGAEGAAAKHQYMRARSLYQELLPLLDREDPEQKTLCKQANLALGELCRRLHEVGPSSDYFDGAIALAQSSQDAHIEGLAWCGRAELALQQGRFDEATKHFHRARSLLTERDSVAYGRVLLGGGRVSARRGDWTKSRSCFESAQRLGNDHRDYGLVAESIHNLGRVDLSMGDIESAHERFGQALKFYRAVNNADAEAESLLDLAHTTLAYRQPAEAKACIEQALTIKQRLGDQVGIAWALLALGEYEVDQLNIEEAHNLVLRALPAFKSMGDGEGLARCQAALSAISLYQGQSSPARRLCQQALAFFEEQGILSEQVRLQGRLAWIDMIRGELDDTSDRLTSTLMLLDVHGSDVHRAEIMNLHGLLLELFGQFAEANVVYARAFEIAQLRTQVPAQFVARLALIRLGLVQQGGRWYYDEMWEIIRAAHSVGIPEIYMRLLTAMSWYEGMFGDRAGIDAAMSELRRTIEAHRFPIAAAQLPFGVEVEIVRRNFDPTQAAGPLKTAEWVQKTLLGYAANASEESGES